MSTPSAAQQLADEALSSISSPLDPEVASSDQLAETLTSLQSLIERSANRLDELAKELKEFRQSLKSLFDNDATLSELSVQAESVNSQVKERKSVIANQATAIRIKSDVAERSEQIRELRETLSNHLLNYYKLTNSTSIDTSDGDQREFEITARIK